MRILKFNPRFVALVTIGAAVVAAGATYRAWLPWARGRVAAWQGETHAEGKAADSQDRDEHADGHTDAKSIELSPTGLKNIDYRPITVSLGPFERPATMPAIVIERPGRSQIHITAPLTGVVTKIEPIQGEAIEAGSPLFEIRLTHEELVAAQRDFLATAENLDVTNKEIARLKSLTEGIVAGKRIIDLEYERSKAEASQRALRESLLLHGLSEGQLDGILASRKLLQSLTVTAPDHEEEGETCGHEHSFHVQNLPVNMGQQVEAGQVLCVLADHCELFVEGRAFEDDADRLRQANREGWTISASLNSGGDAEVIEGLKLLYLADHIDPDSRAFRFYLKLPNTVLLDQSTPDGRRFLEWRFKPGQRMELRVPMERFEERIVLPVEAVVDEGAESYVYRQNQDRFEQTPVHVEYRDQTSAVIANDGSIFPGDVLAARGAYQMHLALKNQSGGGVDPHAGHNH